MTSLPPNVEAAYQRFDTSMPWLRNRTIFMTRHGSHAYGLNTPTSDEDFKGFAMPPYQYIYGYLNKFEQGESHDPDCVLYDIRKFFVLAADCNPSIIEVLFTDPSAWILTSPAFKDVVAARDSFLSRKAKHTFSGYAISQLKRIQRHYEWLTNPPKKEPTRADFGLPEFTTIPTDQRAACLAAIQKKLDEWNGLLDFDQANDPAAAIAIREQIEKYLYEIRITQDDIWTAAARAVGLDGSWLEIVKQERSYNAARDTWKQYQHWKASRNPARAELEAKFGYDTKHGMHLVRLMRMGKEILETGKVIVKRPDREELLAIRSGLWPYEKLVEYAADMDKQMTEAEKTSPLPRSPNRNKLDALCQQIVCMALDNPDFVRGTTYNE